MQQSVARQSGFLSYIPSHAATQPGSGHKHVMLVRPQLLTLSTILCHFEMHVSTDKTRNIHPIQARGVFHRGSTVDAADKQGSQSLLAIPVGLNAVNLCHWTEITMLSAKQTSTGLEPDG